MRAVWRGAVAFGLVTFPVRLFSATGSHGLRFHQVHRADGGRVRHRRVCSVCAEEVPLAEVVKGFELPDGRLALFEAADFAGLSVGSGRVIEVVQFARADEVDPIFLHRSFYVEPERSAVGSYCLLRDVLERSFRVAVVKVVIRRREAVAVVRPRGRVLVLQTLLWPDEVREPDFGVVDVAVESRLPEVRVAASLVESMTAALDLSVFSDGYRDAVAGLVAERAAGAVIPVSRAPEETGGGELLGVLRRSLERVRSGRGGRDRVE
ncbi:Ku protein [Actinosynnema sp. NPDC047251]|uniref:Non-homologous end joining protein Ku n=1 Tax=Saccharothrix espanaensis (strain ATCC 51144 / DSM 44229 / JCM 9112 / NBRC 15066 / NRRL 15764) TaxID=1179773 RepID=K0K1Z0_SACES|nr:Ku protein [Saccharothrix espanaensis]CCH31572.1 putative DNA repair protein, Ku family [Saccharothrix espanaensis DSM 44229]